MLHIFRNAAKARLSMFPSLRQRLPQARVARFATEKDSVSRAHIQGREKMRLYQEHLKKRNMTSLLYAGSFLITFVGIAYAAVPLYRIFCKRTGFMGAPKTDVVIRDENTLRPLEGHRPLKIKFSAQVSGTLDWKFIPEQTGVTVVPGETALAFYKAKNLSKKAIIGIATYNVIPEKSAQYFNKIQCFCFDEQKLDPGEEVDMPVFFFIDPEFAEDPWMDDVDTITLSYSFFKATNRD
ncbi:Cytochrome c oxidase assembly protein cox11, mitochondrial [Mycoemilia scoparia]|uniref:Cytochrome c oxidase assembly protein cox11, mitochondrial n=1 Tax=Mycoemilia scoparia TaxID=417184 RepID=A0A9W8A3S0_9FUNG|nr:Cytochrome c oxidase assembly protein cox11, mitochondrial [Mycoemilia scoparia]